MEASPLVQQARPTFQPKVTQLYEELFRDDEATHTEGFWTELFLLKPDKPSFQRRLEKVSADELLHHQHETQDLFVHAILNIKLAKAPSDEIALDTLTVFLAGVLSKRYTNPSSDIITVLAGLETVDGVFTDFANALELLIRNGRSLDIRKKSIEVALSLTSGAWQTSLVSYFTHRDLFPAIMKYIQESDHPRRAYEPFTLLGLLANYNKFEYRNPYRLRLEDFVNEAAIQKILDGLAETCLLIRKGYVDIIDDSPPDTSWTLANTLAYIGLSVLAPMKAINPIAATEDYKEKFGVLPSPEAAILLVVYDFVNANKLFSLNLLMTPSTSSPVFGTYLSMVSYILHHAYRSSRATLYGILTLSTLRIIVEDATLCKRLCDPAQPIEVRHCRQRPPTLPPALVSRAPAAQILDVAMDTLNHNLRRRLDLDLYTASLHLIHRLLICLVQNHIHLPYHWSLLWQSLLSLIRFLQTYSADIASHPSNVHALTTPLLKSLTLAVVHGNAFLPDPAAYDDLFYKLVESAPVLEKFKSTFKLGPSPSTTASISTTSAPPATPATPSITPASASTPIDVLIATASHFHGILEAEKSKGRLRMALSSKEVNRVIREGYESLEVADVGPMGVENFDVWREGEERGMVKRAGRLAVEDVRRLVGGGE